MLLKSLRWLGDSRRRIREFPEEARQRAGFELWDVQQGNEPSDWKPMPTVGPGAKEIRIHSEGEYRVMYVAKFEEAVYVLHVFHKRRNEHRSSISRLQAPDIEHSCSSGGSNEEQSEG